MGYEVWANDWEEYARVLNSAYLLNSPDDLERLFAPWGGIERLLDTLNSLGGEPPVQFVSRYYAPENTETADYRYERLFYTRENALFIDRVRQKIEEMFPGSIPGSMPDSSTAARSSFEDADRAKEILIALLLYEAATHANTSGVFKAYHKGFGGHSGDALGRITSPMRLEQPVLIDGPPAGEVEAVDASTFLSGRSFDLCYLDPPYNSHQYGSNYHLLNSIARWDFPEVDEARKSDGRLRSKAGIRGDWRSTRSDFCYRSTAPRALEELLNAADCRFLVLSYNSEGIIPFEQLYEMLQSHGEVEIHSLDYVKYRGGRQSLSRKTHNVEFQLVLRRRESPGRAPSGRESQGRVSPGSSSAPEDHTGGDEELRRFLLMRRIVSLFRESFVPSRVRERMIIGTNATGWTQTEEADAAPLSSARDFSFSMERCHRFLEAPSFSDLERFDMRSLEELQRVLEEAACSDRLEEFRVVLSFIESSGGDKRYERRLLELMKKFTHRKYRSEWEQEAERLDELLAANPEGYSVLRQGLKELKRLARLRFEG